MAKPLAKLVALQTPKRRWAQFSLATMFAVMTVASVPCCWLAWKMEHKRRERQTVIAIQDLHGEVKYNWECVNDGWTVVFPPQMTPPGPSWLRIILGDDFFAEVVNVDMTRCGKIDEGLSHVGRLPSLAVLNLGTLSADTVSQLKTLAHRKRFVRLKCLRLIGTQLVDADVTEIQESIPNCFVGQFSVAPSVLTGDDTPAVGLGGEYDDGHGQEPVDF